MRYEPRTMRLRVPSPMLFAPILLATLLAGTARAAETVAHASHLPVLAGLVIMIASARLGGALFVRLGQSPVLGELLAGIVLGNLGLLGWHGLDGGQAVRMNAVLIRIGKSLAFLVGSVWVGQWISRHTLRLASRLSGEGVLLSVALVFCFGFAWLAAVVGLAPIVGAFAAG